MPPCDFDQADNLIQKIMFVWIMPHRLYTSASSSATPKPKKRMFRENQWSSEEKHQF
jgi:hypothetical protein